MFLQNQGWVCMRCKKAAQQWPRGIVDSWGEQRPRYSRQRRIHKCRESRQRQAGVRARGTLCEGGAESGGDRGFKTRPFVLSAVRGAPGAAGNPSQQRGEGGRSGAGARRRAWAPRTAAAAPATIKDRAAAAAEQPGGRVGEGEGGWRVRHTGGVRQAEAGGGEGRVQCMEEQGGEGKVPCAALLLAAGAGLVCVARRPAAPAGRSQVHLIGHAGRGINLLALVVCTAHAARQGAGGGREAAGRGLAASCRAAGCPAQGCWPRGDRHRGSPQQGKIEQPN